MKISYIAVIASFLLLVTTGALIGDDTTKTEAVKPVTVATPVKKTERVATKCYVDNLELEVVNGEVVYTAYINEVGVVGKACHLDQTVHEAEERGLKVVRVASKT